MKISLSHEKLHQLSLYSNFTHSLHAILKLPGNSPTYATLELIYLSGYYLAHAICTKRQRTRFSTTHWKTVHGGHSFLKHQKSRCYVSKSLHHTQRSGGGVLVCDACFYYTHLPSSPGCQCTNTLYCEPRSQGNTNAERGDYCRLLDMLQDFAIARM